MTSASHQGSTSRIDTPGLEALRRVNFGFRRSVPLVLQNESAECGLACLAMIAGHHRLEIDLATLRQTYAISQRGATLKSLMGIAARMELATRAVRVEPADLARLRLPCLLHWNMNHFVVLTRVCRRHIVVHDPASGERAISLKDVSAAFTGIALEAWPGPAFSAQTLKATPVRLLSLLGNLSGISASLFQIVAFAFVLQVLGLVAPLFMQWVVDQALVSRSVDLLTTLAVGFALLVFFTQSVAVLSSWASMRLSTTWSVQWSANVFTHLLRLPMPYFEKRHLGDITSRFQSMNAIQSTLTAVSIRTVVDGVMALLTLVIIFQYSVALSWIPIGALAFYFLWRSIWYRPLRNAAQAQIVHSAKQNSHFLETIRGARTIKLFGNHDGRRSTWLGLLVDQINSGLRLQKLQIVYSTVNGLTVGLVGILVVWLAARMVLDGEFTVGMMMAFLAYQAQFSEKITSLIDKFFEVKMLQVHGERLADILHTEPERQLGADTHGLRPEPVAAIQSLELRNLKFRYSEHDPQVLNGVDLLVEPGECLAITGPSGCGKSTLVSLLIGMQQPTEGEVLLGGIDIANLDPAVLRSSVACVLQNDTLFAGSLLENISFFDEQVDPAWVEECASLASIHDEIAAMPMGYHTIVGHMSSGLSGGQQQRVLLARALYRRPKILILDEATSHLDLRRESLVNAAVRNLTMTRIIVAHRPQTLELADRVVHLQQGRIAPPIGPVPGGAGGMPAPSRQDAVVA